MEASSQLHAAAFPPILTGYEAMWVTDLVWTWFQVSKRRVSARARNQSLVVQPVPSTLYYHNYSRIKSKYQPFQLLQQVGRTKGDAQDKDHLLGNINEIHLA
jgi:hypothetical protein